MASLMKDIVKILLPVLMILAAVLIATLFGIGIIYFSFTEGSWL